MSDVAIRVEGLSKKYRIGEMDRYGSLRESIGRAAARSVRWVRRPSRASKAIGSYNPSKDKEIWAIKDVSFEVKHGEVLGIIGRNGAGKSTLLKLLSRITAPTSGRAEVYGRVGSLLEVGTGFHPELTGSENIYLNGAILGMARSEIKNKFDDIVAFAEIEQFIDTPVKRYSSGMYMRLAFAVAAHLDPEILIVDEVLAVGDTMFQRKCLGKMRDVAKAGRTVLFVSHNLSAVKRLCSRAIVFESGTTACDTGADEAVHAYLLNNTIVLQNLSLKTRTDRTGNGFVRFADIHLESPQGQRCSSVCSGDTFDFVLKYTATNKPVILNDVIVSIALSDTSDSYVWLVRTDFTTSNLVLDKPTGLIRCRVDDFNLASGQYSTTLFMSHMDHSILDCVIDAFTLTVRDGDYFGTGHPGLPSHCKSLTRASWQCA